MPISCHHDENSKRNMIVAEDAFDPHHLGKCESIFSLGNGYLGLRNTHEEDYHEQTRGLFLAGTYNKFDAHEVTELPNAADVVGVTLSLNQQAFSMSSFELLSYQRGLALDCGLAYRYLQVKDSAGNRYELRFEKFTSMDQLHLIAGRISVTALDADATLSFSTGINGQMTNSSVQHFSEQEKRLYDEKYMEAVFSTTQSEIDFVFHSTIKTSSETTSLIQMDRRKIFSNHQVVLQQNIPFVIEKFSTVHTSRDREFQGKTKEQLKATGLARLKGLSKQTFAELLSASEKQWQEKVWDPASIQIHSENPLDAVSLRFALYHLAVMTPAHDNRMSITAKGLSGEGYKGHVFWDTEIFCFPHFVYTHPEIARCLLEYRFFGLAGARTKAQTGGYAGAQYPWEAAWISDGETTPVWGAADIITGEATKIWSGFIEIHITAVVAYAVEQYFLATGDQDFMAQYGYQILFETAQFWASRLEYNPEKDRYEICDVVGPDEYKEHVDNNAFTNHMAAHNMQLALRYYAELSSHPNDTFRRLEQEISLSSLIKQVEERLAKMYLPKANENGIIPQDDTYLTLKTIDLTPYKNAARVGTLFDRYNLEQVNQMQISKQADLLMLMHLLEHQFSPQTVRTNYDYYEPKTVHDSSLSLSTHCILAAKMNDLPLAYQLFRRAAEIDLGNNMVSSDHGIHAASIGGVWQCAIHGFAGLSVLGGKLCCTPRLPDAWTRMAFAFHYQGQRLFFEITKNTLTVRKESGEELAIWVDGQPHKLLHTLEITR